MAKAMKCDICGKFFEMYICEHHSHYQETMKSLPNNIIFNVKFFDGNHDDLFVHVVSPNPASSALSAITSNDRATYDICPNCSNKIINLIAKLYANNKEESE